MSGSVRRSASVAERGWIDRFLPLCLAEVVVAGAAVAAVPQHTETIVRLCAATLALGLAVAALATAARRAGDAPTTPLDHPASARLTPMAPLGLASARRAVRGRALPGSPVPLPTDAWRRLAVVAVTGFARRGIDIDNPRTRAAARRSVSPAVWDALTTPPREPRWRDGAPTAEAEQVAAAVEQILDEVGAPPLADPPP